MMIMERDDTPPDFVAFRESFVNVLFHQDYQGHTRNPNIAIAFCWIRFSESAGWGLNDVIANWTKLGHARPIINNGKAGKNFEVTLMTDEVTPEVEVQATGQVTGEVTGEVFRLLDIYSPEVP